jgi:AsmA protein
MKILKWSAIVIGALVVIVIGGLLIIPMFVDVQKYKPEIEKQVSQATGCPFTIGGDLKLSLFPWAGLAFSDLRLGNPPGFREKDLLAIKSFDARVKMMPLLSKDIQVDRFVVEGLKVSLEKNKEGKGNWEAVGKPSSKPAPSAPKEAKKKEPEKGGFGGLPIKNLVVGEMAVRNGSLLYTDAATGTRKEIKDLVLELKDVSFDRPVQLLLTANLDGSPVQLEGKVGPLGREVGKGAIPLDIAVKAFKEVTLGVKGAISDALDQPKFDLTVDLAPFSPRKLVSALGQTFPVATADPNALTKVALKAKVKGSSSNVSLSDGAVDLDQSKITFSAAAREFTKPDLGMKMTIDQIDVDRYLPPSTEKKPTGDDGGKAPPPPPEKKKTDYAPLRKLVVDAEIQVGKIKVMGAHAQDVLMKLKGKDGVFTVDPFGLKAYEGTLATKANLDVRTDRPKTGVELEMAGVKVRPLLNDLMKKDFLEGLTKAKMNLKMEGDDPQTIKRTLNGSGDLRFTDGAIIGIDLPGMVRNVKAAFGGEKPVQKPKTDFSELEAPFTIKDGVVHTPGTSMASPLIRVLATGNADLVKETLDMRVEPKLVDTLKGQEDTKDRSGVMIPVLVTGTFSSPSFAPDMKGLVETGVRKGVEELLKREGVSKGTAPAAPAEIGKELLKGLFGK